MLCESEVSLENDFSPIVSFNLRLSNGEIVGGEIIEETFRDRSDSAEEGVLHIDEEYVSCITDYEKLFDDNSEKKTEDQLNDLTEKLVPINDELCIIEPTKFPAVSTSLTPSFCEKNDTSFPKTPSKMYPPVYADMQILVEAAQKRLEEATSSECIPILFRKPVFSLAYGIPQMHSSITGAFLPVPKHLPDISQKVMPQKPKPQLMTVFPGQLLQQIRNQGPQLPNFKGNFPTNPSQLISFTKESLFQPPALTSRSNRTAESPSSSTAQDETSPARILQNFAAEKDKTGCQKVYLHRVFTCQYCLKKFSSQRALLEHIPVHTGNWNYICSLCGKGFISHNRYKDHLQGHQGKKFICSICNKGLSSATTLSEHKRIHSGVRSFVCKVCNKSFYKAFNLWRHEIIHTDKRPFKCELCGADYRDPSSLSKHIKRLHASDSQTSKSNVPSTNKFDSTTQTKPV